MQHGPHGWKHEWVLKTTRQFSWPEEDLKKRLQLTNVHRAMDQMSLSSLPFPPRCHNCFFMAMKEI